MLPALLLGIALTGYSYHRYQKPVPPSPLKEELVAYIKGHHRSDIHAPLIKMRETSIHHLIIGAEKKYRLQLPTNINQTIAQYAAFCWSDLKRLDLLRQQVMCQRAQALIEKWAGQKEKNFFSSGYCQYANKPTCKALTNQFKQDVHIVMTCIYPTPNQTTYYDKRQQKWESSRPPLAQLCANWHRYQTPGKWIRLLVERYGCDPGYNKSISVANRYLSPGDQDFLGASIHSSPIECLALPRVYAFHRLKSLQSKRRFLPDDELEQAIMHAERPLYPTNLYQLLVDLGAKEDPYIASYALEIYPVEEIQPTTCLVM